MNTKVKQSGMFTILQTGNEVYILIGNSLVYKRWHKEGENPGNKTMSRIFNTQWPDVILPPVDPVRS